MKIGTRFAVFSIVGVLFVGVGTLIAWKYSDEKFAQKQDELVEMQAVAMGVGAARQVVATRSTYTRQIVAALKPHGVKFSQHPGEGEAPLPAVFVTGIAEKLKSTVGDEGTTFVLRSGWNLNREQGITTDFEQKGWESLLTQEKDLQSVEPGNRAAKYKPFSFRSVENGVPVMKIMTADLASAPACVSCHNKLEASPEILAQRGAASPKVFELGDVMGAVVTTVPLARAEAIGQQLSETRAATNRNLILAIVGGFIFAIVLGLIGGRSLSTRLGAVTSRLREISEGEADLTQRLDINSKDEMGELAQYFNKFVERIQNIVSRVHSDTTRLVSVSSDLTSASEELTTNTNETTRKTEQMAEAARNMHERVQALNESPDEVSTSLDGLANAANEVTTSIHEIAKNTSNVAQTASETLQKADASKQRLETLRASSEEIQTVIEMIQDIADQTTCWPSTRRSKPPEPAKLEKVSAWLQPRSRNWPNRPPTRRTRSGTRSMEFRNPPETRSRESRKSTMEYKA